MKLFKFERYFSVDCDRRLYINYDEQRNDYMLRAYFEKMSKYDPMILFIVANFIDNGGERYKCFNFHVTFLWFRLFILIPHAKRIEDSRDDSCLESISKDLEWDDDSDTQY